MSLNQQWDDLVESYNHHHVHDEHCNHDHNSFHEFWDAYYAAEKENYKKILSAKRENLTGNIGDLAAEFNMTPEIFFGFLGGINDSLKNPLDLQTDYEADSAVDLAIDYEKLYYNMHAAKADWLYELPEWEPILSQEKRWEILKSFRASGVAVVEKKPGRNEPCPCGSGKKYKQCCGKN